MTTIPVTFLSTYLFCKRKLYLQHVLKWKDIPKLAVIHGSIQHHLLDLSQKQETGLLLGVTPQTIAGLPQKFESVYLGNLKTAVLLYKKDLQRLDESPVKFYENLKPKTIVEATRRAAQIIAFAAEHQCYGRELVEKIEPKIETELFLSSPALGLRGKVDKVEITKDAIVPVEYKTGKVPTEGIWESHKIQVACYLMLLSEHFKKPVRSGKVLYLQDQSEHMITLNPFLEDHIYKLVLEVNAMLQQSDIPMIVDSKKKCDACALKERCHGLE